MEHKEKYRPIFEGNIRTEESSASDIGLEREAKSIDFMEQLVPILELSDDQFNPKASELLKQRLHDLQSPLGQVVNTSGGTRDFILDTTDISPTKEGSKYRIDDESIYVQVLPTMRKLYRKYAERGISAETAFFSAAIHTAQIEQTRYFNGLPTKDRAEARSRILARYTGEFGPLSIADLKDAPMCSERAAVAHNVLHMLGIPSTFHAGFVGRATGNGFELADKSPHAFLTIFNTGGKEMLFDPANPKKYKDGDVTLREVPSVYKMPSGRKPVVVEKQNYEKQPDGSFKPSKTMKIVYGFRGVEV